MVNIFAHFRQADGNWENKRVEISRVPCVGEFIILDYDSPKYKVVSVTHCLCGCSYVAEINIIKESN